MISVKYKDDFILVKDDSFDFERINVLNNLLEHLDYECQLDFCIHFEPKTDTFMGVDGDVQPNKVIDIFNAFDEVKEAFDEVEELDVDEYDLSYVLLLKKSVDMG